VYRRPTLLGKIWTSPNSLIGLVLGVPALLFGARVRRGDNAVGFLDHPLLRLTRIHAITFGNVVLYRPGWEPDATVCCYEGPALQRLGDHERAHTIQYERWGPLFLPAYLVLALWAFIVRRPNWLERQADRWVAAERPESSVGVSLRR
jgi:hypothetical protein